MCVCVWVREREWERERLCVCVSQRERVGEREIMCVCEEDGCLQHTSDGHPYIQLMVDYHAFVHELSQVAGKLPQTCWITVKKGSVWSWMSSHWRVSLLCATAGWHAGGYSWPYQRHQDDSQHFTILQHLRADDFSLREGKLLYFILHSSDSDVTCVVCWVGILQLSLTSPFFMEFCSCRQVKEQNCGSGRLETQSHFSLDQKHTKG